MKEISFEAHETHTPDNRRVALWTLFPKDGARHSIPIVVGAGFGRRMHHFAPVALYGAHNGFFVCRYDPLNHVGLSEGQMWDFTLSDSLESLRAAVEWTCEHTGSANVIILATSLTARVAFELASQTDRVGAVVSAVGVTNVRATLANVFEDDYSRYPLDGLPEFAVFEGKKIGREFVKDAHLHDWWSMESCIRAIKRIRQPLINFIGGNDTWVEASDVQHAFTEGANGPRRLLTLDRASHDLGRNASVARTFMLRTIEEVFKLESIAASPLEPSFEELMDRSLAERGLQKRSANF